MVAIRASCYVVCKMANEILNNLMYVIKNSTLQNVYSKGPNLYLVFPVIVIVLSAMFILYLLIELKGKHCQYRYDYDREN